MTSTRTTKHQTWCDTTVHRATADDDLGAVEPCISGTVDEGPDNFAFLLDTDDGPLLQITAPKGLGLVEARRFLTASLALVDAAGPAVTPGKGTRPAPSGRPLPPRPGWGGR